MTKEAILEIVIKKVQQTGREKGNNHLVNCSADTRLYGSKGQIDSITLVFLISELEEEVENTFGKIITLADEKAMSQQSSPFQSVDALASYIFKLVQSHE